MRQGSCALDAEEGICSQNIFNCGRPVRSCASVENGQTLPKRAAGLYFALLLPESWV